eukprot:scaffold133198_cov45-Tisochrysis_lutea.AAC.2
MGRLKRGGGSSPLPPSRADARGAESRPHWSQEGRRAVGSRFARRRLRRWVECQCTGGWAWRWWAG